MADCGPPGLAGPCPPGLADPGAPGDVPPGDAHAATAASTTIAPPNTLSRRGQTRLPPAAFIRPPSLIRRTQRQLDVTAVVPVPCGGSASGRGAGRARPQLRPYA